ncbi:MAG: hypothetical protein Q8R05_00780 [Candidatus Omnitrophota bacterium]|nr:hypothetical protein [Candidatus Omnitrophota bacterium]
MEIPLFSTQEEILKKLQTIARLHTFENAKTISHIFYDVFKIAYYALGRKKEGVQLLPGFPVLLKRKDVSRLVKLIDYHHSNDKTYTVDHELTQCFGYNYAESDALKFFETYVEGDLTDKFGRKIHIDLDDGIKFMYKDYGTGRHEVKSEYYLPHRGKRLPWIRHTLCNSTSIYTKTEGTQREIMYLCRYDLPNYDNESNQCYWAVIVKKQKKDKASPYNFKTAFPIIKYNNLLKRIERYQPVIEVESA